MLGYWIIQDLQLGSEEQTNLLFKWPKQFVSQIWYVIQGRDEKGCKMDVDEGRQCQPLTGYKVQSGRH